MCWNLKKVWGGEHEGKFFGVITIGREQKAGWYRDFLVGFIFPFKGILAYQSI